jgi:hypothetical protein
VTLFQQVAVAAWRAVVRKVDRLARLLTCRTHEAVIVSLLFIKRVYLHLASSFRRVLKQRVFRETPLLNHLLQRFR